KHVIVRNNVTVIPKARPSPLRAGAFAWVQTHDSSKFLRLVFDCCSGLVRQSFDSASTIVRRGFGKPSTMPRENAEAQPSNCRAMALLYSDQFRAIDERATLHPLTGHF